MRSSGIRKMGYIISGIAVMAVGLLTGKTCALADKAGSFTVTGGTNGVDYNYDDTNVTLTVNPGAKITVSGSSTAIKENIHIAAGSDNVELTISGLSIIRPDDRDSSYYATYEAAPISIDDSYTGTVTIIVSGSNKFETYGKSVIEKNGTASELVLSGSGTLNANTYGTGDLNKGFPAMIGGAAGKSSGNITITGGTYTLYPNSGGTAIGGGSSGKGTDITISGGKVDARMVPYYGLGGNFAQYTGAVIGGGANANGENITIKGSSTTVYAFITTNDSVAVSVFGYGAAIGGGCNASGKNIQIQGGTVIAGVYPNICGAAIGSGYKTKGDNWDDTSVVISGGTVTASGVRKAPGIGGYGYDADNHDNANITITGGNVTANGGVYSPGIGGGNYSDAGIYISGGNVKATAGSGTAGDDTVYESDDIGLDAYTKYGNTTVIESKRCSYTLKRGGTGADADKEVQLVDPAPKNTSLKGKYVDVVVVKSGQIVSDYYGCNDVMADSSTGEVYVYLPEGYSVKEIVEKGKTPVDISTLEWDYVPGTTHYYYNNSNYTVTLKTIPDGIKSVTYTNNQKSAKGSYSATVVLNADDNHTLASSDATQTLNWEIEEYPAIDLTILYNGVSTAASKYENAVTITAAGYTISDNVTGTYNSEYLVNSTGAKTLYFKNSSGYIVQRTTAEITIEASVPQADVSGLTWTYVPDSTHYYYKNAEYEVKVDNIPDGVKVVEGSYKNNKASATGTYKASVTLEAEAGYTLADADKTQTLTWKIEEYNPTISLLYNGVSADDSIWYTAAVEVTAAGHKIRVGESGSFASSVSISKTGEETLYFMSDAGGYITTVGKSISVKIDKTSPAGTITVNGVSYKTIGSGNKRVHLTDGSVAITATDSDSGVAKTEYAVYTGESTFATATEIESANVLSWKEWKDGTAISLGSDVYQAVYVRVIDKAGNKAYLSTPLIYNDTKAPVVTEAKLTEPASDKENTVGYSFTLDESSNYYYVLKKASETAPTYVSDIIASVNAGSPGGTGYGKTLSGTFRKLTPNTEYVMYVMADDGMKTLSGADNVNVSAIKISNSVTTTKKEVPVSDQTMYVKAGAALTYTYDPWNMLRSASKTDAEDGVLGVITYNVSVGTGSIVSGDVVTTSSAEAGHNVLQIPIGTGFNAGDKQTIVVTFNYSDGSYSSSTANLTIEAVAKTPVTLDSSAGIDNITYGESLDVSKVTSASWKDSEGNNIDTTASAISVQYTGTDNVYDSETAPSDAGTYKMTISLTDNNYVGEESYTFVINKKDLSDVSGIKWYIESDGEQSECDNNSSVYYDGNDHTVSVSGYPEGLNVAYTDEKGKEIGEYHTVATYSPTSGDAANYILPNPSALTWNIIEMPKEKTVIDVTDTKTFKWKYYKGSAECENDSDFVEDGTTEYSVELDDSILPDGIDVNYIIYDNNSNTVAGNYTAKATFDIDEDQYEFKDGKNYITLDYTIQPSVESTKITPDMSTVKWVYKHVNTADGTVTENGACSEKPEFVWDGNSYTVMVEGLPEEVLVESYNADAEQTDIGEYTAVVRFKVTDSDAYIVPAMMTLNWSIKEGKGGENPDPGKQPEDPSGGEEPDTPVTPSTGGEPDTPVTPSTGDNTQVTPPPGTGDNTQVAPSSGTDTQAPVASIGTIADISGSKYKILTASAAGGMVEYEGQTNADKKVQSITIPATVIIDNVPYEVTAIKSGAFNGYTKLKKVTIGSKVTTIGDKAFYKCTALKSVVIPAEVTEIGNSAFYGCKKLSKITIKSKVLKKVGKNAIKGINKKATIKCPSKKLAKTYKKKLFKSKTGYKKTMKVK